MVDLKQQVDVHWLIDMWTTDVRGQEIVIEQAFQETHLAMNQEGARARSGVAMGLAAGLPRWSKPDLIIDGPFLIWFRRSGLSKPLFVGHITQEDWKKPASVYSPRVIPEKAS
jgi:serine protease inhibitor